jgi:hypothetical protein
LRSRSCWINLRVTSGVPPFSSTDRSQSAVTHLETRLGHALKHPQQMTIKPKLQSESVQTTSATCKAPSPSAGASDSESCKGRSRAYILACNTVQATTPLVAKRMASANWKSSPSCHSGHLAYCLPEGRQVSPRFADEVNMWLVNCEAK